uniref:Dynein axonemal intermediate chain 4 n=1 Tax=Myripristis murdjan TaxID=586833 RepID=A0A667Z1W3_9TELE
MLTCSVTVSYGSSSRALNGSISGLHQVNHSSRHTGSNVSRKGLSMAGDSRSTIQTPRQTVRVLNENGTDVTPQPISHPEPGAKHNRVYLDEFSGPSDILSMLYQPTTAASLTVPFSRSVFCSSKISRSSLSTIESVNEERVDTFYKQDNYPASYVQVEREEVKEQVTEDMLNEVVNIYLTETETITHLDMPGISVSVDADDAEAIKERNNRYAELCKNRMGNDKYMDRSMQAFIGASKSKQVQCDSIVMVDTACEATTWDMYDSFYGAEQDKTELTAEPEKSGYSESIVNSSRGPEKTTSLLSTTSIGNTTLEETGMCSDDAADPRLILQSEKFQKVLLVMERCILANIFQPKLAAYRQLPIVEDCDSVVTPETMEHREEDVERSLSPTLESLWVFSCELTKGRTISCMAWNKKNPDLLAVGYGEFDFRDQTPGLVCCWSLKNPTWPERVYHCNTGVTSLDFSAKHPYRLAVGMTDGTIAIYYVYSQDKTCAVSSSKCSKKHYSSTWQVKWAEQDMGLSGDDKEEALMSISADGRISKWFLHDDLDLKDKKKKGEILRSLNAGFCFDFHPVDSSIYLAGSIDGTIYKCSSSNSQQFLETYSQHFGPVTRIKWCPFNPNVFLSCSLDWTIKLWIQDQLTPLLCLTSTQKQVHDIMWSPKWATVFGAINEGQMKIWNLDYSTLDPVIVHMAAPGVKMTSLLFALQTDCVLVGDNSGQVTVYQIKNFTVGEGNQVDTLESIISSAVARL